MERSGMTPAAGQGSTTYCAHCGEPIAPQDLCHTVVMAATGLTVSFHGSGVCNDVANGGSGNG
jgi:hypothetical protein